MVRAELEMVVRAGIKGDFNLFRKHYDEITFEERKQIAKAWNVSFPNQKHYSPNIVDWVRDLSWVYVIELGCHKGELAREVIKSENYIWAGYDILPGEKEGVVGFYPIELMRPFYEIGLKFSVDDLFVCSHTFEHMNRKEVSQCICSMIGVKHMVFDIPIQEEGQDWNNYHGSHVLTKGRVWIREMMKTAGYNVLIESEQNNSWQVAFRREV